LFTCFSLIICLWCLPHQLNHAWNVIESFDLHLDHLHLTMGTHLLCLESITHHNFQFGPKGFKRLLPFMVQASPSSSTNSSGIWPTMNFFPTSLPSLWSTAPCPFVNKRHQAITSLWVHLKICIQTILETFRNSEVRCIAKNHLIQRKTYAPWPTYTSPCQFLACS